MWSPSTRVARYRGRFSLRRELNESVARSAREVQQRAFITAGHLPSRTVSRPFQGPRACRPEPALRHQGTDGGLHLLRLPAREAPPAGDAVVERADRPRTRGGGEDFGSLRRENRLRCRATKDRISCSPSAGVPRGAVADVAPGAGNGPLADQGEQRIAPALLALHRVRENPSKRSRARASASRSLVSLLGPAVEEQDGAGRSCRPGPPGPIPGGMPPRRRVRGHGRRFGCPACPRPSHTRRWRTARRPGKRGTSSPRRHAPRGRVRRGRRRRGVQCRSAAHGGTPPRRHSASGRRPGAEAPLSGPIGTAPGRGTGQAGRNR